MASHVVSASRKSRRSILKSTQDRQQVSARISKDVRFSLPCDSKPRSSLQISAFRAQRQKYERRMAIELGNTAYPTGPSPKETREQLMVPAPRRSEIWPREQLMFPHLDVQRYGQQDLECRESLWSIWRLIRKRRKLGLSGTVRAEQPMLWGPNDHFEIMKRVLDQAGDLETSVEEWLAKVVE